MAGGTFIAQNKIRPGAYINFQSVPRPMMTAGDRGIGVLTMPLSWGSQTGLISVLSEDLLTGRSLSAIGFTAFDPESKLLAGMLNYCYMAKVFRADTGGVAATATVGGLTATARYPGAFGNNITVAVRADGALFIVETYVKGAIVDSQTVAEASEVDGNDYVTFAGTGALSVSAGMPLTGGTNGTVEEETAYTNLLSKLTTERYQTLAVTTDMAAIKANVATFIKKQRDDEGRYVQAVVANYDAADNEGVINNVNGAVINGVEFTPEEFTVVAAGMTAGARIIDSNTGRVVDGASQIIGELDNTGIIAALQAGKFVLSPNQSGAIKVEQDINSLHTFIPEKNKMFSKNRIIRTLDEIGISVRDTWESAFMGKVNNDDAGRAIFKSSLLVYMGSLQEMGAITNFEGSADIEVLAGNDVDAVVCNIAVQPVDSMEKLYMTVRI